jgi:hypothetical protein
VWTCKKKNNSQPQPTTNNNVALIINTTNNAQIQPNDQYNLQQLTTTNNGQPTALDSLLIQPTTVNLNQNQLPTTN